jgi:hypothetical protein
MYIPTEFANDDCLSNLSREHELKHAEAQDQAIQEIRPELLAALNSLIQRVPRGAAFSSEEALASITSDIGKAIDEALGKVDALRVRLNSTVDTPEEQDRVRHACGGRTSSTDSGLSRIWVVDRDRRAPVVCDPCRNERPV